MIEPILSRPPFAGELGAFTVTERTPPTSLVLQLSRDGREFRATYTLAADGTGTRIEATYEAVRRSILERVGLSSAGSGDVLEEWARVDEHRLMTELVDALKGEARADHATHRVEFLTTETRKTTGLEGIGDAMRGDLLDRVTGAPSVVVTSNWPQLLHAIAELARGRADATEVTEEPEAVRMTVTGDTKALVDAIGQTVKTVIERDPLSAAKLQPRIDIRIEARREPPS